MLNNEPPLLPGEIGVVTWCLDDSDTPVVDFFPEERIITRRFDWQEA
jgi:hypothetical protein